MRILLLGGCGYIGSSLYLTLSPNHEVDTVDIEAYGNKVNPQNYATSYRNVLGWIKSYDVVILAAAHSSVAMCQNRPYEAFKNNVTLFVNLLQTIDSQKFIYMSSSSVYNEQMNAVESTDAFMPHNYYDLMKWEADQYALMSRKNFYALRLGTVNGWSPNLRTDVMINMMVSNAVHYGKIEIMNKEFYRPILGISDLTRAVSYIVNGPDNPGIYNLSSFNTTVQDIGSIVADRLGIKLEDKGSTGAYNFSLSSEKFSNIYGFEFTETPDTIVGSFQGREILKPGDGVRI